MNEKKKELWILAFLILALLVINYPFFNNALEGFLAEEGWEYANVSRVIDGDTIEINGNESVRLLGINTPERGEKYYKEAKEFLAGLVSNKTIKLERMGEDEDKYKRSLRYVFLDNRNINIELVKNGFANYYFYSGKDRYSTRLENAWENCLQEEINLCESSDDRCAGCIDIEPNYIINQCGFSCNITSWQIKGEGRAKIIFNAVLKPNEKIDFELNVSNSGDSLFLRDEEGKLVLWGIEN
jgi:endonuclease YncB( thermonuclease family)